MLLYRISKSQYASDLSGEGAGRAGGRWNLKGNRVIYTSDSTALATLETIIHAPLNLLPDGMAIITIELPDGLRKDEIFISELPDNWHSYPAPVELAQMGTKWIKKCGSVSLRVPSSVTPFGEGRNYLLNPVHPDFKKIRIINVSPYVFNGRFFKNN